MSFASVEDLQTYLGPSVTINADQAQMLLDDATAVIVDGIDGQQLELVEGDEISLRGNWQRKLYLPQRPVVSVASITIDTLLIDETMYRVTSDGEVTFYQGAWAAVINYAEFGPTRLGYWGGDEVLLDVVYTHGYEEVPQTVQAICRELVKRAIKNPDAGVLTEEHLGVWAATYVRDAAMTLTQPEKDRLRIYRKKNHTMPIGP